MSLGSRTSSRDFDFSPPNGPQMTLVSDGLRRLPKVSDGIRGSPRVLDGFRRFPDGFRYVACMHVIHAWHACHACMSYTHIMHA